MVVDKTNLNIEPVVRVPRATRICRAWTRIQNSLNANLALPGLFMLVNLSKRKANFPLSM